jgi:hypothetical protein
MLYQNYVTFMLVSEINNNFSPQEFNAALFFNYRLYTHFLAAGPL